MVWGTEMARCYPASNVLTLAEVDYENNCVSNYWMAKYKQTAGQGFVIRLDDCARLVTGLQIKNLHKNYNNWRTKEFRVSGSLSESGPWTTFVEEELVDVGGPAPLLDFTFEKPEEVQFLKFDLLSFWGDGGALQYFAAIPAEGKFKPQRSESFWWTRFLHF